MGGWEVRGGAAWGGVGGRCRCRQAAARWQAAGGHRARKAPHHSATKLPSLFHTPPYAPLTCGGGLTVVSKSRSTSRAEFLGRSAAEEKGERQRGELSRQGVGQDGSQAGAAGTAAATCTTGNRPPTKAGEQEANDAQRTITTLPRRTCVHLSQHEPVLLAQGRLLQPPAPGRGCAAVRRMAEGTAQPHSEDERTGRQLTAHLTAPPSQPPGHMRPPPSPLTPPT